MEKRKKEIIDIISNVNGLSGYSIIDIQNQIGLKLPRLSFLARYKNKSVVFRIYIEKTELSEIHFKNEMLSLLELEKKQPKLFPKLINFSEKDLYLIESFAEGRSAGNLLDYSEDFICQIKPIVIVDLLKKIKKCNPKLLFDFSDFRKDIVHRLERIKSIFTDEKIVFWAQYFMIQFDKDMKDGGAFSHGDVSAGNIIYENGQATLIDWESAKYEPYFRDFSGAYYRAINFSNWQREFIKEMNFLYHDKKIFEKYYIYLLLNDATALTDLKNKGGKNYFRSGEMSKNKMEEKIKLNYQTSIKLLSKDEI